MLKTEIMVLKAIDHPNIIKLEDIFEDDESVYLVFEFFSGGELFEPIIDGSFRFSERQADQLIRKVLLAVKFCHDHGIIHRDLKPENLLLQSHGVESELKLIDFGLASYVKTDDFLSTVVGTPYYMSPEVLEKHYSCSSDLWSSAHSP